MLKGIPKIVSPELIRILCEMGHGDELVLSDANFPGTSIGQKCVRCDGHGCAEVMKALLTLFPLDDFVEAPLAVMQVPEGMFPGDKAPIWEAFRAAADTDLPTAKFDMMEHDAFMERAKKAAICALVQAPLGSNLPPPMPVVMPFSTAQDTAPA